MKIWHISDTHGYHKKLNPPKVDIVIHSGDFTNHKELHLNEPETNDFLDWYSKLDIEHKILVAGNHDTTAFNNKTAFKERCKKLGITYLEDDFIYIDNTLIYGSPWSPLYGDWSFMKQPHQLKRYWDNIPLNIGILVTHCPPHGILDVIPSVNGNKSVGCKHLKEELDKRVIPKLHLFGHIHNQGDVVNFGTVVRDNSENFCNIIHNRLVNDCGEDNLFKNNNPDILEYKEEIQKMFNGLYDLAMSNSPTTTFSNGSVVTDFMFGKEGFINQGNIFEI